MIALYRFVVGSFVALALVLGMPTGAHADDPPAPIATTLAATDVTATTATFHAKVDPDGTSTSGYFAYGTAPDQLTLRTPTTGFALGSGEVALTAPVSRLTANTKYYVMVVAENDDWVVTGDVVSFSTLAPPEILGGSATDITYRSATLHLNVATHGQPVTLSGSVRSDLRLVSSHAGGLKSRSGGVVTPFGPVSVTADGDVAIPLAGLDAGAGYSWGAKVTSLGGDGSSGGTFRTESLISMWRPRITPTVATYGSHVTVAGTVSNKPGLVVTLAEQAFPFGGPIGPLIGTTATTDATGAYVFDLRAEHPAAYGVTAEGAVPLAAGNLTRLKVAPALTARLARASRHRFVVAGRYQPAIAGRVSLFRRGAGRVGVARASNGTFRFPARALRPGRYEVRVTPAVTTGFANAKSAAVVVPSSRR